MILQFLRKALSVTGVYLLPDVGNSQPCMCYNYRERHGLNSKLIYLAYIA